MRNLYYETIVELSENFFTILDVEKVERGTKYATYLIEHDVSLRECGAFFKVSKSTISITFS